jgi:hypothetical protein
MSGAIPPLSQYVFIARCIVSTGTTSPFTFYAEEITFLFFNASTEIGLCMEFVHGEFNLHRGEILHFPPELEYTFIL